MIAIRKSNLFFLYLAINLFLFFLMLIHASYREKIEMPSLQKKSDLVKKLELTDLCLVTEASYTRHLSQADLHTPFQDHPISFEHFPSGSLLMPPGMTKRPNGKLD